MLLYQSHYTNKNIINDTKPILKKLISNNTTIVCVGSDKIILDCLGPLVGTMLKTKTNLNVIGDLFNPITAKNISTIYNLNQQNLLVIDCCINTDNSNINNLYIYDEPAFPGGLKNNKLPVGSCKILASVDHINNSSIYTHCTSLSHIYSMATIITNMIINSIEDISITTDI